MSFKRIFYFSKGRFLQVVTTLLLSFTLVSCGINDSDDEPAFEFEYDFTESSHDWEAFFTDYNVEMEEGMNLTSSYKPLPESLDSAKYGHFLSAINTSDDVKMLLRKEVEGLQANTTYEVRFTVRFATNEPAGCVGIGGAPGEAVRIIAAASESMPEAILNEENEEYIRLNIQQRGGPESWYQNTILGNIANSQKCEEEPQYEIKELDSEGTHDQITTSENGNAWLLFGSRSGFEGQTDLYFTYFRAEFWEILEAKD